MKYDRFIDAEGSLAHQLGFLAKGVSKDKTRYFMNEIYVETSTDGTLLGVATDGRHLHIVDPLNNAAEIFGMTPGYWHVLKNARSHVWVAKLDDSITKGWVYPNWRKVIPTGEAAYKTTFYGVNLKRNFGELAIFLHDFPDVTAIDLNYLQSLGDMSKWNVEWYGSNKALKFTESDRTAVIMPMQL